MRTRFFATIAAILFTTVCLASTNKEMKPKRHGHHQRIECTHVRPDNERLCKGCKAKAHKFMTEKGKRHRNNKHAMHGKRHHTSHKYHAHNVHRGHGKQHGYHKHLGNHAKFNVHGRHHRNDRHFAYHHHNHKQGQHQHTEFKKNHNKGHNRPAPHKTPENKKQE